MPPVQAERRSLDVLVWTALVAILVLGVTARLEDPLSTPVMGAEDPWSHVVFTKEALENGRFGDSFYLGTPLYPPGLHAFMGALAPISGTDLYDFAMFAPIAMGAVAILGMYVLGARLGGRPAGLGAAFVTAIIPEHIFRTELLFPTALDLALVPAWLLVFHEALVREGRERIAFLGLTFAFAVPLAFAHPWVVPLLGAPMAIYAALRTLRGATTSREAFTRLLAPAGTLIAAVAFATASRWRISGTGFGDFLAEAGVTWLADLSLPVTGIFLVVAALLILLAAPALAAVAAAVRLRDALPAGVRLGAAVVGVAALLMLLVPLTRELPYQVNYWHMLGRLPIALAAAGFVLAALRPSPLADLGAALSIVLFPLTALQLFEGPFWAQRTVVYLSLGVALLAGAAIGQAYVALTALARKAPLVRRGAAPVALAALLVLGTTVSATARPSTYDWYRLYDDDDFRAFQETATLLESQDGAQVFVYAWQPALYLRTLSDLDQVWYSPKFFKDADKRAEQLDIAGDPAYFLVDAESLEAATEEGVDLSWVTEHERVITSADGEFRLYRIEVDS